MRTPLGRWLEQLPAQVESVWRERSHGDMQKWSEVIAALPSIEPSQIDLNSSAVTIRTEQDCDEEIRQQTAGLLKQLHPWRKGPFDIVGIRLEHRVAFRLEMGAPAELSNLRDRLVLDVGCGGYHCFSAWLGKGRQTGDRHLTPRSFFVKQFEAIRHFWEGNSGGGAAQVSRSSPP
ncbi:DUF1698 domain-containing protein, partial [endosymbiont of Lamellibrachia barhami]|uniref:DUF1698 domain-containing protein n=1 Tax=endosymbiont of Lamellibrachia barhami TaxID=205975 RepID=UPI0015A7A046